MEVGDVFVTEAPALVKELDLRREHSHGRGASAARERLHRSADAVVTASQSSPSVSSIMS